MIKDLASKDDSVQNVTKITIEENIKWREKCVRERERDRVCACVCGCVSGLQTKHWSRER